ncbi:MAG: 50S ribosomal protein L32 [Dehalococcoidales bacterium]|nr:MAG: 50S ribosomal protein L32 [Dehalococcoidales bacterium]
MGALPKRKTAKARKNKRRSHQAWSAPTLVECTQCHSPKLQHRVCPTCGSYAGRDVIEIKSPRPRAT